MSAANNSQLYFAVDTTTGKPSGRFIPPATKTWHQCEEKLDAVMEKPTTYGKLLSTVDSVIKKEPSFLDAYAHAGDALLEIDETTEAFDYYNRGLGLALKLIPKTFKGGISWLYLDNRPFLRLHHGYILCLMHQGSYEEAARYIEQHLAWNPNDNVGVRYLLGDACLLAGKTVKARRALTKSVFSKEYVPDPSNAYSLGLLEFREGNYTAAAKALRVGFVANMYIAELLTGRVIEKPHFFWHGSSDASVKTAKEYLAQWGMLGQWEKTPQAIDFVDWLYNSAVVMRDRLEMTEIREGLAYEEDLNKRIPFCERNERLVENIQKQAMLIQKVKGRRGEQRWPWEHSRVDLLLEE